MISTRGQLQGRRISVNYLHGMCSTLTQLAELATIVKCKEWVTILYSVTVNNYERGNFDQRILLSIIHTIRAFNEEINQQLWGKQCCAICFHVATANTMKYSLNNSVRKNVNKSTGKRPLERPRRRWEDNTRMDFKEIQGIELIRLRIGIAGWPLWMRNLNLWAS